MGVESGKSDKHTDRQRIPRMCRDPIRSITRALVFQAGTAESFSLLDSDERKNQLGTPKLKTNFSVLGKIVLSYCF